MTYIKSLIISENTNYTKERKYIENCKRRKTQVTCKRNSMRLNLISQWKLKTRRTWSNTFKLKHNYQPRLLYSAESSAIVEEEKHFT